MTRILGWLESEPDTTARLFFDRLMEEHPGQFASGQIRTLQKRTRNWGKVMARKLLPPSTVG